eukprot:snap_masked-scaffold_2-processed-gene-2.2-mRNA-1 protein AED:1.00 eAED:1.00 QI:0/0/0/0/1/1/2/0/60
MFHEDCLKFYFILHFAVKYGIMDKPTMFKDLCLLFFLKFYIFTSMLDGMQVEGGKFSILN